PVAAQGSRQPRDDESSTRSDATASMLPTSVKLLRFVRSFIPRNLPNEYGPTSALTPGPKYRRTTPEYPSCGNGHPSCNHGHPSCDDGSDPSCINKSSTPTPKRNTTSIKGSPSP